METIIVVVAVAVDGSSDQFNFALLGVDVDNLALAVIILELAAFTDLGAIVVEKGLLRHAEHACLLLLQLLGGANSMSLPIVVLNNGPFFYLSIQLLD